MKRCLRTLAVAVGLAACGFGQAGTPPGPYTSSCQNPTMRGNTLHAKCPTAEGKWVDAQLRNAGRCSTGIINLNGILVCQSGVIPPGSYLSSCDDIRLEGSTLRATCKDEKDKNYIAELRDSNQCPGDIANQKGKLRCVEAAQANLAGDKDQPQNKKKKKHRWLPVPHL